jgi:hypothetical protein
MSDTSGDGDIDVDAAWAEIVAHWDADDLRVVTDDEEAAAAVDAVDVTDGAQAPTTEAAGTARTGDDGMTWTEIELEDWSGTPGAVPPVAPPAPGQRRPVGRAPHHEDDADAVPGLGWDAIRPPADAVRPARREDPPAERDDPALAALDEHFVPDDPPSLHPTDPVSALAWLGALGGPLFLLVAALVWRDAPSVLIGAAVLAFVAGFVTLVVRMPDEREDTDDGAVV